VLQIELGAIYNINDYDELARMFLPRGAYELAFEQAAEFEGVPAKLAKAREMYAVLVRETGRELPWGVLTGVKPVKLFGQLVERFGRVALCGALDLGAGRPDSSSTICPCSTLCDKDKFSEAESGWFRNANLGRTIGCAPQGTERRIAPSSDVLQLAVEALEREYLVSREKVGLLARVYERERAALGTPDWGAAEPGLPAGGDVLVYVGIPFCPTRCTYCTFTAGVGSERQMREYLDALYREIDFVAGGMRARGMRAESVYVGGGTPTALTAAMLEELLGRVGEAFLAGGVEFTVEAGRPDSITYEKALCIARAGATRASVNPQTMNDETLGRIGRAHLAADIYTAFEHVRAAGAPIVNADVIAGLPGEGVADFEHTVAEMLKLGAENITLHTLSLKKGSAMRESDPDYSYYADASTAEKMLRMGDEILSGAGMGPYYLYRQKQTVGNLENVGYAGAGTECVYNIRMMQERQTVVALGAGAVSKLYFPAEDRIERVFNMADTGLYIERIGEMIERKRRVFEGEAF